MEVRSGSLHPLVLSGYFNALLMRQSFSLLLVFFILLGCREGRSGDPVPQGVPAAVEVGDTLPTLEPGMLEEEGVASSDSALFAAVATEADSLPQGMEDGPAALLPGEDGVRFPRPKHVRGIYLNAWTAGSPTRRGRLIDLVKRTELNAFVIDIKDVSGYVSFDTKLPLAREVGATEELRIRDLPGLMRQLEEAGVYPIARIVVAKDPLLSAARPDLAIQDSAGGPWLDQKDVMWLNFHHPEVWQYHLELAQEAVRAGFPEIQWDYVRFPDAPESYLSRAVYPGGEGRSKTQSVSEFLGYTRELLGAQGAQVTADVFGVTTSYRRDVGIGQLWEAFIDQVDVALPMVYPSHYWTGSFGIEDPNAHPYEIVRRALRDGVKRSALVEGAGAIRPWLQDFSLGDPPYGAPEVRAQIQATYDAGIEEWILLNPGSRYTESALIPARGLPSWLEPVMRVGGEVVVISKRFEVLGEEGEAGVGAPPVLDDPAPPTLQRLPGSKALPVVPLPDTGKVKDGG